MGIAVENPCKLCVSGNLTLNEDDALFGVKTDCKKKSENLVALLTELFGVLSYGNCVKVGNGKSTVEIVRKSLPVFKCTKVVAKSGDTSGLNAGKKLLFSFALSVLSSNNFFFHLYLPFKLIYKIKNKKDLLRKRNRSVCFSHLLVYHAPICALIITVRVSVDAYFVRAALTSPFLFSSTAAFHRTRLS